MLCSFLHGCLRGFARGAGFSYHTDARTACEESHAMTICQICSVLPTPPQSILSANAGRRHDQIVSTVRSAFAAVEPRGRPPERRREARYAYPYPIHLTPYGDAGLPNVNRTFVVIGKHLAPHGLDFYFSQPLGERRVIASLDCGREGWIGLVLELDWCRFSRHGWYDNGGRFVAIVTSPLLELNNRPRAA